MAKQEVRSGKYADKVIPAAEVDILRTKGYKAIDPHLHSSASHDVFPAPYLSPGAIYDKMGKSGFDFITFTDHDTLAGYGRLADESRGLDSLVRGVEIKIKPAHIKGHSGKEPQTLHNNVYNLNQQQFEDLEALAKAHDFYGFIDYCRKGGLAFTYNHPTWCEPQDLPDWSMLPDIMKEYDVIEVYNRGRVSQQNGLSLKLAEMLGKGIVSSSDSHIGLPVRATLAKGADFGEYWEHVKAGESLVVPGSANVRTMKEQVFGWMRAFSESDRIQVYNEGYNFRTGSKKLDKLINFLTGEDLDKRRIEKTLLPFAIKMVTHSMGRVLINAAYLSKQKRLAGEIEESIIRESNLEGFLLADR